ncbi:MAG: hypothetical protein IKP09_03090 [Lentisphaeria bacterium]|jgi:hypothetical protein|nr:hypothetical protein [Lentisphaeria bacterium]
MNQKTRTALYSLGLCACVISAATAVILTINAHNRKPRTESVAVEEAQEEEQPKPDRPRRRGRRGGGGGGGGFHDGRRGDVTRLLPDGDDFGQVPTPEEFEEELVKGLEEYRALAPHERARLNDQMHQTTLFVRSGLDMMRENIHEIPPEELDRIRDDFDRFSDAAEQTFFSGIVEQYLTPEEDATIGEFVRTMHDATNEFRDLLHST